MSTLDLQFNAGDALAASQLNQMVSGINESLTELPNKANKDGYYENLGAGYAKSMLGTGASVPAELTRRTAGGTADIATGVASFKSINGNTIVWNQHGGTQELQVLTNTSGLLYQVKANHKFLVCSRIVEHVSVTFLNFAKISGTPIRDSIQLERVVDQGEWFRQIFTFSETINCTITPYTGASCTGTFLIYDLTQMFCAGNEPASVEEFEAMFPNDYYPYNAGQLLSLTAQKFVTDGFNAFNVATGKADVIGLTPNAGQAGTYQITGAYTALSLDGETITPDTNGFFTPAKSGELSVTGGDDTTCVHLVWSGVRNGEYEPYWKSEKTLDLTTITGKLNGQGESVAIFPDGMRSAGTAHDELLRDASGNIVQAVKGIESMDMGTLNWGYSSTNNIFYATFTETPRVNPIANIICDKYVTTSWQAQTDKTISREFVLVNGLNVRDNSFNGDVTAFKTAMSGVMLYYERAEPQTYVLDEPLDPNYRVDDFGTESIEPLTDAQGNPATAPFKAEIVYGPNVQDTIRRLPTMYLSIADYKTGIANLASALGTSLGKNIAIAWSGDNGSVPSFTITDNPTE